LEPGAAEPHDRADSARGQRLRRWEQISSGWGHIRADPDFELLKTRGHGGLPEQQAKKRSKVFRSDDLSD
jgi:hypothetical protein